MDPEKNSPQKIDLHRIQQGLSQKQMKKIAYECDLLRMDMKTLLYVAPHLFNDYDLESSGVEANYKPLKDEKTPTETEEKIEEDTNYYGDDYDDTYYSP